MKKYVCDVCGWEYDEAAGDPEHGIAHFVCPLCGVRKESFSEVN